MSELRYSVVGLGKLGACMAAAIAARGHEVVGVDVDSAVVESVAAGTAPVVEPGLQEAIELAGPRLRATHDAAEAVASSDITFVVVPTPSDDRGAFSLEYARMAFAEIGRALARKDAYHLVVLTSTVLPGAVRHGLLPVLEQRSGKRTGRDFGVCYGPEFIALGSVIRDFLNPDFLLVGELDARSGELLERAYGAIVENAAPCRRMSLENAELAKIALNAFVTTKIAFANTLADLCEELPGGDVDAVTGAIGLDRRIGSAYLRGGLGFGGPCFPRDSDAFAFVARELGVEAPLAASTSQQNQGVVPRVVARIEALSAPNETIGFLGLAYKPETNVTEESQALEIARRLALTRRVLAFDPLVRVTSAGFALAESVDECVERADVVVVANPDPAFASTYPVIRGKRLIDLWRCFEAAEETAAEYVARGRGSVGSTHLAALWGGEPEIEAV